MQLKAQLLKNQADSPNTSFGLRGSVAAVDPTTNRRITVIKQVESQFRTKNCSLSNKYPKLGVFPYPAKDDCTRVSQSKI